jgi:hypothetical protein
MSGTYKNTRQRYLRSINSVLPKECRFTFVEDSEELECSTGYPCYNAFLREYVHGELGSNEHGLLSGTLVLVEWARPWAVKRTYLRPLESVISIDVNSKELPERDKDILRELVAMWEDSGELE